MTQDQLLHFWEKEVKVIVVRAFLSVYKIESKSLNCSITLGQALYDILRVCTAIFCKGRNFF